jgi:hypothetical protein
MFNAIKDGDEFILTSGQGLSCLRTLGVIIVDTQGAQRNTHREKNAHSSEDHCSWRIYLYLQTMSGPERLNMSPEIYQTDTSTDGCRERVEYIYGGIEPFGESLIGITGLTEPRDLFS